MSTRKAGANEYAWAHHEWTLSQLKREFRVYSVQPYCVLKPNSAAIFNGVLTHLLGSGEVSPVANANPGEFKGPSSRPKPFNLLTFPEAFLSAEALVLTLKELSESGIEMGCVHTGLKPNDSESSHLFNKKRIEELLESLGNIDALEKLDLVPVKEWLSLNLFDDDKLNLAVVFTIDSSAKIRICIHPKISRSTFEENLRGELHVKEVSLIQAVSLFDVNKIEAPVHLLPLICSDFINKPSEVTLPLPIEAAGKGPPSGSKTSWVSHFDLISVVNCTPTSTRGHFEEVEVGLPNPERFFWKYEFLKIIERMCEPEFGAIMNDSCVAFTNVSRFIDENDKEKTAGLTGGFVAMKHLSSNLSPSKDLQIELYCKVPDEIRVKLYRDVISKRWENVSRLVSDLNKIGHGKDSDLRRWDSFGAFVAVSDQGNQATIFSYTLTFPKRGSSGTGKIVDASVMNVLELDGVVRVVKREEK